MAVPEDSTASVHRPIEPRLNSMASGEFAASRGSRTDSPRRLIPSPSSAPSPTGPDEQRTRPAARHREGDGVGELDRGLVAGRGQVHVQDAVGAAERHPEPRLPVAAADLATRVAFELERATDPEVAADRVEPPGQALRVGERVPHVLGLSVVGAAERDRDLLAGVVARMPTSTAPSVRSSSQSISSSGKVRLSG